MSDQNYLIATLERRRKSQLFNVNLLNLYHVPVCGAEDVTSIVVAALSEGLVSGRVETGEECLAAFLSHFTGKTGSTEV